MLKTIIWFLKRPHLFPELFSLISNKLFPNKKDATRKQMEEWCAGRCVDTNTAIGQLTDFNSISLVSDLYSFEFEAAMKISKECPIEMGGPGDLNLLYWITEHLNATTVIETGVAYGWSSLAILLSLKNRTDSKLISTDMPYPNKNNEAYVGCVVPNELRSRWHIIKSPDRKSLPEAIKMFGHFDLCHYDSDKSYAGRMWAYPILWKAIKKGGVFISDDIGDNVAFRDFTKIIKCKPIIIRSGNKYIGVVIKST